jgi:hypothetical protein
MTEEAARAIRARQEYYRQNPGKLWEDMIRRGVIDEKGNVLLNAETGLTNQVILPYPRPDERP